jgi:hypothetical protein
VMASQLASRSLLCFHEASRCWPVGCDIREIAVLCWGLQELAARMQEPPGAGLGGVGGFRSHMSIYYASAVIIFDAILAQGMLTWEFCGFNIILSYV